jgi:hypothetical protein
VPAGSAILAISAWYEASFRTGWMSRGLLDSDCATTIRIPKSRRETAIKRNGTPP